MKTVLVMTSTFPRWKNDTTSSFVYDLSKRLAKDRKIIVLAPHAYNAAKIENLDNLEVHRFQYFPSKLQKLAYGAGIIPNIRNSFFAKLQIPFFLISEYISARNLIKKHKPGILHAHWIIPQGVLAAILKKLYKLPFIITIHGSDLFPLKNVFYRYLQKLVLSNCDVCTVNSMAGQKEIVKRFPIHRNKVNVIPMGVDTKLFVKKTVKFKQYSNKKIILFVGRLNEQKGIKYLIKSMPLIIKKFPDTKLLVIGEGNYKDDMEKLIDSLDMSKYVEFLGAISHSKLIDYYNLADIFVLPSITSKIGTEGFGLVLLEAMACETCVIGTKTGGIKYIITDNKTGLLVKEKDKIDLANKVIQVFNNEKLRNKLAKNGAKLAKEDYSWDKITKSFDKIYESMLK